MDWNAIGNSIWEFIVNGGTKLVNALLIFIFGYIIIKIIKKVVKHIFSKTKFNSATESFLTSIIGFALNMVLILAILSSLGVETTGLIALLSAAGLAISLSLQNSLSNLANGVVIIGTQPFEVGDYVSVDGTEGTVTSIRMLTTTIRTSDNKMITIPNSTIVNNPIINYNKLKTRRSALDFSVAYETDIRLVKQIIYDVIASDGRTLTDPAPNIVVKELGDDYITLTAYFWEDGEDYYSVNNYVREMVINEFKKNGIPRNHKHYSIKLQDTAEEIKYEDTPLPPREEKIRKIEGGHNFIEKLELKAKELEKKRKEHKQKAKSKKKAKKEQSTLESDE